jgi:uncharacterized membrane protein YdjX (TVP38/TMEM64 family)
MKRAVLVFWLSAVAVLFVYLQVHHVHVASVVKEIFAHTTNTYYGPLIFIALYGLRPFLFLPVVLLTSLAGMMFGFWPGVVYAFTGEVLSCSVAYWIGWFFGADAVDDKSKNLMGRIKRHVEHHPFFSVLVMRLAFLPYEVVDYASAVFGAPFFPYFLATVIGSVTGAVTLTSVGASLKNVDDVKLSLLEVDRHQALMTLGFAIGSLLIAFAAHWWYTNRHSTVHHTEE